MPTSKKRRAPIDFKKPFSILNRVMTQLGYKIEREWSQKYSHVLGGRELLLIHVRTAHFTCRSILYLAADKPFDANRLLQFCVALPPLNRAMLDCLFSVMFL